MNHRAKRSKSTKPKSRIHFGRVRVRAESERVYHHVKARVGVLQLLSIGLGHWCARGGERGAAGAAAAGGGWPRSRTRTWECFLVLFLGLPGCQTPTKSWSTNPRILKVRPLQYVRPNRPPCGGGNGGDGSGGGGGGGRSQVPFPPLWGGCSC